VRTLAAAAVALTLPIGAAAQEPGNPIDARVQASFDAAERYQGPLDGGWTLVSAGGAPIFAFQLVDRAGGQGPLEGVFRDLRHDAVPGDIEMVDALGRTGGALTLTLHDAAGLVTVTLHGGDGGWVGEMRENGVDTPVKLRRS
jgi:hypothetical protein